MAPSTTWLLKTSALSDAIAEAVYKIDPELILFGLAGGELIKAGKRIGLRTASEVFSDRTYQQDGSLTSRQDAHALIKNHKEAVHQVITMVKEGKVHTLQGSDVPIVADTVCIHGDGENALDFAKYISSALTESGIKVSKINEFSKRL